VEATRSLVFLRWTPPVSLKNKILGYVVRYEQVDPIGSGDVEVLQAGPRTRALQVYGLTVDFTYEFTVSALTSSGEVVITSVQHLSF
jgi:hypothetical protein